MKRRYLSLALFVLFVGFVASEGYSTTSGHRLSVKDASSKAVTPTGVSDSKPLGSYLGNNGGESQQGLTEGFGLDDPDSMLAKKKAKKAKKAKKPKTPKTKKEKKQKKQKKQKATKNKVKKAKK